MRTVTCLITGAAIIMFQTPVEATAINSGFSMPKLNEAVPLTKTPDVQAPRMPLITQYQNTFPPIGFDPAKPGSGAIQPAKPAWDPTAVPGISNPPPQGGNNPLNPAPAASPALPAPLQPFYGSQPQRPLQPQQPIYGNQPQRPLQPQQPIYGNQPQRPLQPQQPLQPQRPYQPQAGYGTNADRFPPIGFNPDNNPRTAPPRNNYLPAQAARPQQPPGGNTFNNLQPPLPRPPAPSTDWSGNPFGPQTAPRPLERSGGNPWGRPPAPPAGYGTGAYNIPGYGALGAYPPIEVPKTNSGAASTAPAGGYAPRPYASPYAPYQPYSPYGMGGGSPYSPYGLGGGSPYGPYGGWR